MKKRVLPLALVLTLCMALCANAATPRYNNGFAIMHDLTVNSSTAKCTLKVTNVDSSAKVTVSVDLQVRASSGSYSSITGWSESGTGNLIFSRSFTDSRISQGNCRMSYTITVTGVNGTDTISDYV